MNVAEAAIRHKTVTVVMTIMLVGGGILAYQRLGRLEDPEFTIKEAQVITRYPGASPSQVAEEVTDLVETAVQEMGQLKRVTSISMAGLSIVRVEMKDKYDKHSLPQVWDELRRKVNDAQGSLPPGAGPSKVVDDFGDVYGAFFAVYGDGFTYAELYEYAKMLRRELLLVTDVAKVSLFGVQDEVVYVEISRARLSQLGIAPEQIYAALAGQNLVSPSGRARVGDLYLRIQPTGEFTSVEEIGNVLISPGREMGSNLYLKDIATLRRGYADPPQTIMRFNGHPAIGLGISTVQGGNVVIMGRALDARLKQLQTDTPVGIELGVIALQSDAVTASINGFMVSLLEALAIVIGVLMIAMGLRSGLLIGLILLLTVLMTFIGMMLGGVLLERISLGALIIALGMLVDNAIVVVEGILTNIQRGMKRVEAASQIVKQTMWPLFGATIVAVLAFAAIGASQDSTGEYCRSLFLVIMISLMSSWVLAITVTPLLGVMFLKQPSAAEAQRDPYDGIFFRGYRAFLTLCLRLRWVTLMVMAGLLVLAIFGFGYVKKSFFPSSTRPQFMMHYWLPEGTHILRTEADLLEISEYVQTLPEVTDTTTFVGQGALRFLLTYSPEDKNSAYGMLLVSVDDYRKIDSLIPVIQQHIAEEFPDALAFGRKFILGPGDPSKIQARFRGPDPDELRKLAQQAKDIIYATPNATDVLDDWRQRVPLIQPVVAQVQANNAGITRANICQALQSSFGGVPVGVYREGDELLSILAQAPLAETVDVQNINNIQIWSPAAGRAIPLRQVVLGFETVSENSIIRRRDRLPTITVKCDPAIGEASPVLAELMPRIEAIPLPPGYTLEWGGEYEDSGDAQAALKAKLPVVGLLMVLVVVILFDSVRQPAVIFLTVPLSVIGVTVGLLVTRQPFGFMALLGLMSLSGMLIKNAIVLIDEINAQRSQGKPLEQAILESGVSRVRPVSMAALTTVLGMIPLLTDAFFQAMAVTIMFGLTFATVLTLIVVPVLYAVFYSGSKDAPAQATAGA